MDTGNSMQTTNRVDKTTWSFQFVNNRRSIFFWIKFLFHFEILLIGSRFIAGVLTKDNVWWWSGSDDVCMEGDDDDGADRLQIHCWCLDGRWHSNKGRFLLNHYRHHHHHHHRHHHHLHHRYCWYYHHRLNVTSGHKKEYTQYSWQTTIFTTITSIYDYNHLHHSPSLLALSSMSSSLSPMWHQANKRGISWQTFKASPFTPVGIDRDFDHHDFIYLKHHHTQHWKFIDGRGWVKIWFPYRICHTILIIMIWKCGKKLQNWLRPEFKQNSRMRKKTFCGRVKMWLKSTKNGSGKKKLIRILRKNPFWCLSCWKAALSKSAPRNVNPWFLEFAKLEIGFEGFIFLSLKCWFHSISTYLLSDRGVRDGPEDWIVSLLCWCGCKFQFCAGWVFMLQI